jgi:DNA-directed RNA polymerase specialized sigma24 family protein
MDMEFIDHVARETVVPGWWFPAWDLGLLWSAWVPPRVRNAAAQRLATLIPPGIKDRTARTALQEFAASAQESSIAVLQEWLFPAGICIAAADASPPFTWIAWQPFSLAPQAYFLLPSLDLAEQAWQWLLRAARNDARRNLLGWAPEGHHGRPQTQHDQPWMEVKASPRHTSSNHRPRHDLDLMPTDTLASETLVEIQDLLQALDQGASPRERQVLSLLAAGASPADMARELHIPHPQVGQYVLRLRKKLARLKAG